MLFPWYIKYPNQNDEILNLDWILSTIDNLVKEVANFVSLNTIKYADPIQWNITTQYEKNTVVIEPNTGTAYISTKPVPSGIAISNTDYWDVIFTLDIISANKNITLRDDGNNVLSTFESVEGDWLMWQGKLYVVTRNIDIAQAYVEGYNIDRATVEYFVKLYIQNTVNYINNKLGDLNNLETVDKSNIVASINELVESATSIINSIGNLNDLETTDKTDIVASINELVSIIGNIIGFVNIADLGAIPDTDATAIINQAINDYDFVIIPNARYYIDGSTVRRTFVRAGVTTNYCAAIDIYRKNNKTVICLGTLQDITTDGAWAHIVNIQESNNINWLGGNLIGNIDTHDNDGSEWYHGIGIYSSDNVVVKGVSVLNMYGDGIYTGVFYHNTVVAIQGRVTLSQNYIKHCGRNGIAVCSSSNTIIENCEIEDINRTAPKSGIDIEGESTGTTQASLKNIKISGVSVKNADVGIWLSGYSSDIVGVDCNNIYMEDIGMAIRTTDGSTYSLGGYASFEGVIKNVKYGAINCYNKNKLMALKFDFTLIEPNTARIAGADSSGIYAGNTPLYNIECKLHYVSNTYNHDYACYVDGVVIKNVSVEISGDLPVNNVFRTSGGSITDSYFKRKVISNPLVSDLVANNYNDIRVKIIDDILYIDGLIVPTANVPVDSVLANLNISLDSGKRMAGDIECYITDTGYLCNAVSATAGSRIAFSGAFPIQRYIGNL